MTGHKVVDREEWQAARTELLRREKEHTRAGDELARERRELPWVAVEKEYRFDAGLLPHLHARDVTLALVSQAPLDRIQAYQRRIGWSIPWVSAANTDFNYDLGASYTPEQVAGFITPAVEESLPPIVARNAAATGTDIRGYLSESPMVSVFTLADGTVYQTYGSAARGVEFLMPYYPLLDRVPAGRDEGEGFQLWIRRRDEY